MSRMKESLVKLWSPTHRLTTRISRNPPAIYTSAISAVDGKHISLSVMFSTESLCEIKSLAKTFKVHLATDRELAQLVQNKGRDLQLILSPRDETRLKTSRVRRHSGERTEC